MIHRLALSKITLDDFEEWLTAASWNAQKNSDTDALRMVGKIELYLAEADAESKSYDELLRDFANLSGIWMFKMGDAPSSLISADSSCTQSVPFNFQFGLLGDADKRYGVEFSYTPLLPA
jgi:hypothetical protein